MLNYILLWFALLIFLLSVGMIAGYFYLIDRDAAESDKLAQIVAESRSAASTTEDGKGDEMTVYQLIAEKNPDMVGWISIENTEVDYPVMQTPESPEFYLRKDFDKDYSISGMIFADSSCAFDFEETQGKSIILYGHNMYNGTMFSVINEYQDKNFFKAHNEIHLYTLTETSAFEVVGIMKVDTSVGNNDAETLYTSKFYDEQTFDAFKNLVYQKSILRSDAQLDYQKATLILSTCVGGIGHENERLVLVAVQNNDE